MATVTLNLYSGCRIIKDKNFVVDDIESYLSTISTVTTISNFQYQRFELKKTINLDLDQVWQTKKGSLPYGESTVSLKWNYCKITTADTINYYYFITGYKQISPKTVELSLEMDTLNTFKYYYITTNSTYTLSPKTIVKREHKDRFKEMPAQYKVVDMTAEETFALGQIDSWESYQNTSNHTTVLTINTAGVRKFMDDDNISVLSVYYHVSNGAYIQLNTEKFYNLDHIVFDASSIVLYDSQNHVLKTIPWTSLFNNFYIKNFVVTVPPTGGISQGFVTGSYDWTLYVNSAYFTTYTIEIIGVGNYYERVIDPYQEGLSTVLFKTNQETLYDADGTKHWMLAYRNDEQTATTVNTLLYPEDEMTLSQQSSSEVTVYPENIPNKSNQEEWLNFMVNGDYEAGNYIEVEGTRYEVIPPSTTATATKVHGLYVRKQNSNDMVFKNVYKRVVNQGQADSYVSIHTNVPSIKVHGWGNARIYTTYYTNKPASGGYWQDYWIGSKTNIDTAIFQSWKDVKLFDSKLIKAFMFPYCPSQYLNGQVHITSIPNIYIYGPTEKAFILNSANDNDFSYEIKFDVTNPQSVLVLPKSEVDLNPTELRKIKYESKLYHSDYYQPKFIYDSFGYTFNLEDVDVEEWFNTYGDTNKFSVNYTVSTNIVSKFAFQFLEYITKRSPQDYEGVLCVERNNEKALYNSDYLNYIKNGGYSYDQKKANSQNAVNGITTALSIVGAGVSFASTPVTGAAGVAAGIGLATTSVAGITRTIHSAIEQDKAISQKMLQSQMQANTVEGSEDLDILTAITGNKAKLATYQLSDMMKKALWDLFFYCGYATHEQKVPSVYTRYRFNFVQAEIEYNSYSFNDDIAQDIKEKWSNGITFLHNVSNVWDFDQKYENWEVSLM